LQHVFDVVDAFVDEAHRKGFKRWLTALRDLIAFKIGYAYGLRAGVRCSHRRNSLGPLTFCSIGALKAGACSARLTAPQPFGRVSAGAD
jgi:hypothetical protein